VAHTLTFLEELRGVAPGELGPVVQANAARVFGW
jgi:hypothetical protein